MKKRCHISQKIPYEWGREQKKRFSPPFLSNLVLLLFLTCVTLNVYGQGNVLWDGSSSSNWNVASNWSTNSVPTINDTVYIAIGTPELILSAEVDCANLIVQANATLTVAAGGKLTINDHTSAVTVLNQGVLNLEDGGEITMSDDFKTALGSNVNISGGVLNIGDDWVADNGTSDAKGNITITGGIINVGEDCRFSEDNFSGDLSGDYILTIGQNLEIYSNSCSVTGGTVVMTGFESESGVIDSPGFSDGVELYNLTVETETFEGEINALATGTHLLIKGDLTVSKGTLVSPFAVFGQYIEVRGDINFTDGIFNNNEGDLRLTGSNDQEITSDFQEMYDLTINKSGGTIYLNDELSIFNELTLTSGIINTDGNTLAIQDDATISGTSNSSYVEGFVRKVGNEAFVFPTGANGNYRPISMTAPSLADDEFTATYIADDPDKSYSIASKDETITNLSILEYWELNREKGSSNVSVTLSWNENSGVGDLDDLVVARWDGSQWKDHGNASTTGNTESGTITSQIITSFSPFTLGSTTPNNPLPVELVYFKAENYIKNEITLSWQTASEVNNDFFTIERSIDAKKWESVKKIKGAGNSNQALTYRETDCFSHQGIIYYRLKQTDFDGTYSYSHIETIQLQNSNILNFEITIYPNPGVEKLIIKSEYVDDIKNIRIINSSGNSFDAEIVKNNIDLEISTNHLQNGLYYLVVIDSKGNEKFKKFIVSSST